MFISNSSRSCCSSLSALELALLALDVVADLQDVQLALLHHVIHEPIGRGPVLVDQ